MAKRSQTEVPMDLAAEWDCVASIMYGLVYRPNTKQTAETALAMLKSMGTDAFVDPLCRTVYGIAEAILDGRAPAGASTIEAEAVKRGIERNSEDMDTIASIAMYGDGANPEYYAGRVIGVAKRRMLLGAGERFVEEAFNVLDSPDDIIARSIERLKGIDQHRTESGIVPIEQLAANVIEYMDGQKKRLLSTGFPALNDIIDGFLGGEVIIVGARTSTGKTAFALSLAMQIVNATWQPSLFLTMEMPEREMVNRVLSIKSHVPLSLFRSMRMTDDQRTLVRNVAAGIKGYPLLVRRPRDRTIRSICSFIAKVKRDHDIGFVVIDYLQLLHTGQKVENRQVEVARISGAIKDLAVDLDIPVLLLAQLNRKPADRKDAIPHLTDLRESGAVEQDADCVLLLHRPYAYYASTGNAEAIRSMRDDEIGRTDIVVAKMRNGQTGTCAVWFQAETACFVDNSARIVERSYAPATGRSKPLPEVPEGSEGGSDALANGSQLRRVSSLLGGVGVGAEAVVGRIQAAPDRPPAPYPPFDPGHDDGIPF